jgi:hypothetical protein
MKIAATHIDELPPLDSRSLQFDIGHEARLTLVDLIRGDQPKTIMGMLLAHRDGIAIEAIAIALDEPVGLVCWNVEKLEREDLCVLVAMGEGKKVVPIAAYTERNR